MTSTMTKVKVFLVCWICQICDGKRAMIEVKISSDMPLPMPRSVISSPSHMMTAVPAVMVMTMTDEDEDRVVGHEGGAAVLEQRARRPGDGHQGRWTAGWPGPR